MKLKCFVVSLCVLLLSWSLPGYAQTVLPAPADAGRVDSMPRDVLPVAPTRSRSTLTVPETTTGNPPAGADTVRVEIRDVRISGVSVYSRDELAALYTPYLGATNLSSVWRIAKAITQRYQTDGYFLSRAYVPAQEIDSGIVRLRVVEGYVGEVRYGAPEMPELLRAYIQQLTEARPLKASALESFMLRINDLGGVNVEGVLEPLERADEAAVGLVLQRGETTRVRGAFSLDNAGSRFLGPYQASASIDTNLYSVQTTRLFASASVPFDELQSGGVSHTIPFYPGWSATLAASYVHARPGATLSSLDIDSTALSMDVSVNYQMIRQREQNLAFSLLFGAKNTDTDIFSDVELSRDRIRAVEASMLYNGSDRFRGYNIASLSLRQGVGVFGASDDNDPLLTRADADPHFTSVSAEMTRQQVIGENWSAVGSVYAQASTAPLFSAEEFGYGGAAHGRAYDPSEITGDQGISAAIEARYDGVVPYGALRITPYGFYDIGKVWNKNGGGNEDASSAGGGVYLTHESGVGGNIGIAFPLTKDINTPIYGHNRNPRITAQLSARF